MAAATVHDRRRAVRPATTPTSGLRRGAALSGRDIDVGLAPMVTPRPSPPPGTPPDSPHSAERRGPCSIMADVPGPGKGRRAPAAAPGIHLAVPAAAVDSIP